MSTLVLNENTIDPASIKTEQITIDRVKQINMGTRIWFQLLSSDAKTYQRWSMTMDPTDETLLLVEQGDNIEIQFIEDNVEDLVSFTFKPFTRNVILSAKFV